MIQIQYNTLRTILTNKIISLSIKQLTKNQFKTFQNASKTEVVFDKTKQYTCICITL